MAINQVGPAYYGPQPRPYYPGMPPQQGYGPPGAGYAGDVYRPGAPGQVYGGVPPQAPMPVTGQVFGGIGGLFQGIIGGIIKGITGFFSAIIGAVTGLIRGIIEIFTGKQSGGNPAAPYPGVPFNPAAPPMGGVPIPPGPTSASDPRVVKAIAPQINSVGHPQMAVQLIRAHMQRSRQQHESMLAEAKDIDRMTRDLETAAQRRDLQRINVLRQQIIYRLEDLRQRSIAVYDEALFATVVNNALLSPAGRFGAARVNMSKDLEVMWRGWNGGPRFWVFGHIDGAQEIFGRTNQRVNDVLSKIGAVPNPAAMQPGMPMQGGYR